MGICLVFPQRTEISICVWLCFEESGVLIHVGGKILAWMSPTSELLWVTLA